MTSPFLCGQLIVVEAVLKPHCQNTKKYSSTITMSEDKAKGSSQTDENSPPDSGSGTEPGIEFLKGAATEASTSFSDAHRLPLIHNLPGATTFYNSYRSVLQGWKNSTPRLVQYHASELEVVVYRKNGQVDTLRGGTSANEGTETNLKSDESAGAEKMSSFEGVQSKIFPGGFKQLEIDVNSSPSKPRKENVLFQPSAPSTPPPASPFAPNEFRFVYSQSPYDSLKNNVEELPGESGMQSKLIPDLEGIVTELLKNPDCKSAFQKPSLIKATAESRFQQEYEHCGAKDTKELCALATPAAKDSAPANLSGIGTVSAGEQIESSAQVIPSCNGNIRVEDRNQSESCIRATIVQRKPFDTIDASTQTSPEEVVPSNSTKPEWREVSCQAEMNPVNLKDSFAQCKPEHADISCQVEIPASGKDRSVQCKPDNTEFACQVNINPVVGKDNYVQCKPEGAEFAVQCKPESAEFACQVEIIPVVGKDNYVQCKPEGAEFAVQCNPEVAELACQVEIIPVVGKDNFVQCKPEGTEFACQVESAPVAGASVEVQCKPESAEFGCQVEIIPVAGKDNSVQCKPEGSEFTCQVGTIPAVRQDIEVQCQPEYNSKEVQTPTMCCKEQEAKLTENQAQLDKLKKIADTETKKWKNAEGGELTLDDIDETISRFMEGQKASKKMLDELGKQVDTLREAVQQSNNSFGGQESCEYFEDAWLPSETKEEQSEDSS